MTLSITDALKNDIAHVGDLTITAGRDLGQIAGLANLKNALFHRLLTVPGTLVHRPTYGVGIPAYQNAPSSFSIQQKLASLIQEQFEQDPRVDSVTSVNISNTDDQPQTTRIAVFVVPVGYTDAVQMICTPFGVGT